MTTLPSSARLVAGLALAATFCAPAWAQALHDGDIELGVSGGMLQAVGAEHFHAADGYGIFEGNLGDLAGGLYSTDDPGYDSEDGTFTAGAEIFYTALGSLSFWNGGTWSSAAVPTGVTVRVNGNLGEESFWGATGLSGDVTGLIGQAGVNGKIHEHLDMTAVGSNRTVPGAYLIKLQLSSSSYASSDPFYIALNRGLSEADFEGAVHTLTTAPVPEPSTWLLMLGGLAAAGLVHRKRSVKG